MLRIKIIHKGLFLVGVPLLLGIAFVALLCYGVAESDRLFQQELSLKDAMVSAVQATRSSCEAHISYTLYLLSKDKFFKKAFKLRMREAKESVPSFKRLNELLKDEPELRVPQAISREEIINGNGISAHAFEINKFGQKLEKVTNRQTQATLNSMNWLQIVLIGGLLLSVLVAVILVISFCLNITSRLLIIVNNTKNLSEGTPLSPPLEGLDEIAELDQFLFKSAAEIRELERFKQQMIGVVSHELKSPLSSVEMFLSSMSNGVFGEINPKTQDKITRTHKSVVRLMGLVKELLYLDRLELEMLPEQIAANEIITTSTDTVRELSEQLGVKIEIKNDADKLFADRNRIVQVVVNLLSNAMKFSPKEGIVTIETSEKDGWFQCRVSDQGPGIPQSMRNDIFEPFKQVDSKDATTKKGTGLGLTISRSIVEQHGGKIGVDSIEGSGSTFWFVLPSSRTLQADNNRLDGKQLPTPSKSNPSNPGKLRPRSLYTRLNVLHKGLIIISVPLVFQLLFGSAIGCVLYQVREHINRENRSIEILNTLGHLAESENDTIQNATSYWLTKNPAFLQSWHTQTNRTFFFYKHLKDIAGNDPNHLNDVKEVGDSLAKSTTMLAAMKQTGEKSKQNEVNLQSITQGNYGSVDAIGGTRRF